MSTRASTAVNMGMVLATSDATPAVTRLTPKTNRPLDTVVILKDTTKMLNRSRRFDGKVSPRRNANPSKKVPPMTVRMPAMRSGVE